AGDHALFLSATGPWRRPQLAIEATRRAGVPLRLAGGPLDAAGEHLDARLRELAPPHVTFAGRVPDPVPALQEAGVLIHCADREPYGMALVEALACGVPVDARASTDRKSTRLNSSHSQISYAVFCLKKKKKNKN